MKFIDSTEIYVRSGDGGRGMVSFKTARNMPKLGADGGDGGFGGHVIFVGNPQLNTLSTLRYREHFEAGHGDKGGPNGRTGADGEDVRIYVPLGTQIFDTATDTLLHEILSAGDEITVAEGGRRGLGNQRFLSSRHQAPEEFTLGTPGVEMHLRLELKLLADVGLAGFPNAGKSTLLSVISAAKPKIADYPFTTLVPNLGVVDVGRDVSDARSFVMADIPGLIEGASEGRGLGHAFLRHLERTKVIAFVIDAFGFHEPIDAYEVLKKELENYRPDLAKRRHVIVLNKVDLEDTSEPLLESKIAQFAHLDCKVAAISAVGRVGIQDLKEMLYALVQEEEAVMLSSRVVSTQGFGGKASLCSEPTDMLSFKEFMVSKRL
jgi:GTP-binding protein